MPEEDAPTVISQSGGRAEVAADPADDWLSDASELDWFEEPGGAPRPRAPVPAGAPNAPAVHDGPPPVDDVIRRRRAIALVAGLAAIVIVVLLWLLVFSGGGGSTPPTPTTTPIDTTPAVTTTPATPVTSTPTAATTTTTTTPPATGGAITVTLPAGGKIQPGDTSAEVKSVQQALNQIGAAQLTADGIYGPLTQQAVSTFQSENGLTVDGIVGAQTAAALNAALKTHA